MVQNIVGSPVQGDDFFDREREVLLLEERLQTDNVLLLAPRRVGKTSLMYRLRDKAILRGVHAQFVSVSDVTTELAFVQKLYDAAWSLKPGRKAIKRMLGGPFGRFLRRIKKLGLATASVELGDNAHDQWADLGSALTRTLDVLKKPCLFLIDELPVFVLTLIRLDATGLRARTFLNWFRQMRLDPEASRHVRWLLAGSIGLDTVTQRHRLGDTINDLFLFNELGAFQPPVADALLDALAKTRDLALSSDLKARIRDRLGWLIPFHLQLFFSVLRDFCSDQGAVPDDSIIEKTYQELLSPGKKGYFDYWEQRLTEELGPPDDRQALDLLGAIAAAPEGASPRVLRGVLDKRIHDPDERDHQLKYLLDVLQSDGYIVLQDGQYRFRSHLLRDFWVQRMLP